MYEPTIRKMTPGTKAMARGLLAKPIIVVAEDDDELRMEICADLEREGFAVVPVPDGEGLVGFLGTCQVRGRLPDMIISDNFMPGYSGMEVLQTLTEQGWTTPVIIISGHNDGEHPVLAHAYGAKAYLSKPLNFERLHDTIYANMDWSRCA